MRRFRTTLAATAALGVGVMVAAGAAAVSTPVAGPAAPSANCPSRIPLLDTTLSSGGWTFDGSLRQPDGPLRIRLHAKGNDRTLALQRFTGDYDGADLAADVAGIYAGDVYHRSTLRRLERHTVGLGGLDVQQGDTATMTVNLRPGTYYLSDDSGNVPKRFRKLRIYDSSCKRAMPPTSATVTMTNNDRFGGADVLPARGSILVKNTATDADEFHAATLFQVKPGTTRKQVVDGLLAPEGPDFLLGHLVGTDILSPGKRQVLTYSAPKGTYALICFFPDLADGMPRALKGMVKIVKLK